MFNSSAIGDQSRENGALSGTNLLIQKRSNATIQSIDGWVIRSVPDSYLLTSANLSPGTGHPLKLASRGRPETLTGVGSVVTNRELICHRKPCAVSVASHTLANHFRHNSVRHGPEP
jgi:hypothetical protein